MSDDDERALIDERMAEPVTVTWGHLRADIAAQDAAEVERLRAENAVLTKWQCVYPDGHSGLVVDMPGGPYCELARSMEDLAAEVRRLRAKEAQDAADAARFRWLLAEHGCVWRLDELVYHLDDVAGWDDALVAARAAIDAAMKEDAAEAADDELAWIADVAERIAKEDAE